MAKVTTKTEKKTVQVVVKQERVVLSLVTLELTPKEALVLRAFMGNVIHTENSKGIRDITDGIFDKLGKVLPESPAICFGTYRLHNQADVNLEETYQELMNGQLNG